MAAATKVPEVRDITRVERIGKQTHVLGNRAYAPVVGSGVPSW